MNGGEKNGNKFWNLDLAKVHVYYKSLIGGKLSYQ